MCPGAGRGEKDVGRVLKSGQQGGAREPNGGDEGGARGERGWRSRSRPYFSAIGEADGGLILSVVLSPAPGEGIRARHPPSRQSTFEVGKEAKYL